MAWLGKVVGNVQQLGQRAAAELNEAAHGAQRRITGKPHMEPTLEVDNMVFALSTVRSATLCSPMTCR